MKKLSSIFLFFFLIFGFWILNFGFPLQAGAATYTVTEEFTTTTSKDAAATTAIWDTQSGGKVRLPLDVSLGGRGGANQALWDGKSLGREFVGNGMYFYKIISGDQVIGSGKLVIFDQ